MLRDAHRYAPGVEQRQPTLVTEANGNARRRVRALRERARDVVEQAASRAGFTRSHFEPVEAAERLAEVLALAEGFDATYARLSDEWSRQMLVNVLKLRVLGPYHAPLPVTPEAFRAAQARADSDLRVEHGTFEVSDPWFSPLSRYRVPARSGGSIELHGHSAEIASVFLLDEYCYARGGSGVDTLEGDVVLDIGGCWGDTALYFADRVGPSGKVYTFEFNPESLAIMRANLALNPTLAGRIEIVERALWDSSGQTLEFWSAGAQTAVVPEQAGEGALSATSVTVDDFVRTQGIDRVGFVKMDVEGSEPRVLRGARAVIERDAPRLAIAAYHRSDDLVQLPAATAECGVDYAFFVDTASPLEDETVLFATPVAASSTIDRVDPITRAGAPTATE